MKFHPNLFIGCVVLLSVFLFSELKAQENYLDSLQEDLLESQGSEKIHLLLEISEFIGSEDVESAVKYVNEALLIAEQNNFEIEVALCQTKLASLSYQNAQYDKSLQFYRQAFQFYNQKDITNEVCSILIGIGQVFHREGILDSALYYFESSLDCAKKHSDTLWEVVSHRSIGNVFYKKGQFDQALKSFYMGLSLADISEKCVFEKSRLYNNLGVLMSDWGEYEESLDYYRKALMIMDPLKDVQEISRIFNNMGTIFWYQSQNDSALYYYSLSLENRERIGDDNGRAYVLNNLGMYYGSLEDYPHSLDYFMRSLSLFEMLSNRSGIVMALYNIGSVYQELADYPLSSKYFNQSLSVSKSQGFSDYVLASLEALQDVYSQSGEWEKAYQSLDKYQRINDSLRKIQNVELLKEMELSYEYEKNQADLNVLKNKMDSAKLERDQSWVLFIGAIIILALLLISIYLIIWQVRSRTNLEHDKLSPALIRYQMNPQFINSSLEGIKELISKNRVKESNLFLTGFAKIIRTFIESSTNAAIVLEKEIETTKRFLQLHQLRYDQKLNFEMNLSREVEPEIIAIPPFVFFPIYVYVIDNHLRNGEVDMALFIDAKENMLSMKIDIRYYCEDLDLKADEQGLGHSFNEIKQRIKLLNKSIKEKMIFHYEIHIDPERNQKALQLNINFPIKPD